MDYFDCANLLYKMAEESTVNMVTPEQDQRNKTPNYAAGGAAVMGAVGAGMPFRKAMGPKKIKNPEYMKGAPKKIKRPFLERMGGAGKAIASNPGKFGKSVLGKGLVGAGVGLAGGVFLSELKKNTEESKFASDLALFEKVALDLSDEDLENIRKGEIEGILNAAAERHKDSFLDDIDCEVCGYKGKPTNKGLCPVCGAVLGIEKDYIPAIKPSVPYDGYPTNGITVYEQAAIDDLSTQSGGMYY